MSWDWERLKAQQQGRNSDYKSKKKEAKKKFEFPTWMMYTSFLLVWVCVVVLLWFPVRWLHYKFAYENKVQQQIIEMVNPNALKDKYRKDL